jgi:hypothetical protein
MWVFKCLPLTKTKTLHTERTLYIAREEAPLRVLVPTGPVLSPRGGGGSNVRKDRLSDAELYLDLVVKGLSFLPWYELTASRLRFCQRENRIVVQTTKFRWNVRGLCRSGSLKTLARELERYRLDFVGVQWFIWGKRGTQRAVNCSGRRGVYTWFWCANLRERDHLEDLSVNDRLMLQWILNILNWLRVGTGRGLLWTR